jgi:hypothetical protein
MLLELLFIHIFNPFNHYVGWNTVAVLLTTIFRIIIIVNVHIIIIDDLNDLWWRAFSKLHLSKTHCIQLGLQLGVVNVTTLRIFIVWRTLLILWIILTILMFIRTAISRIDSRHWFGLNYVLFGDFNVLWRYLGCIVGYQEVLFIG